MSVIRIKINKNIHGYIHGMAKSDIHTFINPWIYPWIYPWISISTATLPISSPVRLLIQKLFWAFDEGFKMASRVAFQIRYLPFKFRDLLGDRCSVSIICGQFSWRCCWETRALYLVESAAHSGSRRLHSSTNLAAAEINKLQLLFATTLTLTLRHSDVIFVQSWN